MSRLLVHVEGETEESFVKDVLGPHLYAAGYLSVTARMVGNSRLRSRRGGIRRWESVQNDIVRHLKADSGVIATTMVDYYALPHTWPGRRDAETAVMPNRADIVQSGIHKAISDALGVSAMDTRFVPYVAMHEFEGMLFSDCEQFASALGAPHLEEEFQEIRDQFPDPEAINDSPTTAPSKRVTALMPRYNKVLFGPLVANAIGLSTIRAECPNFDTWLTRLEDLAP